MFLPGHYRTVTGLSTCQRVAHSCRLRILLNSESREQRDTYLICGSKGWTARRKSSRLVCSRRWQRFEWKRDRNPRIQPKNALCRLPPYSSQTDVLVLVHRTVSRREGRPRDTARRNSDTQNRVNTLPEQRHTARNITVLLKRDSQVGQSSACSWPDRENM